MRRLLSVVSFSHPNGDNPKAPLWVKLNGDKEGEELSYRYILKALKKIRDRSDISKPVNPHHFRHSRATYLASRFTESQMCEWFGWVQGSDRPQTYVHLSGRNIDSTYNQLHGIEKEEELEKPEMSPRECPRCGEINDSKAKFCQQCAQALTKESFEKLEEKRNQADNIQKMFNERIIERRGDLFSEFMEKPEVKNKLDKINT